MSTDNSIKIKYYEGFLNKVDNKTKRAVETSLQELQKKIEPLFFSNLNVHVATTFNQLDTFSYTSKNLKENAFSHLMTDGAMDRVNQDDLFLQEMGINTNNFFIPKKCANAVKQTMLHELAHRFDWFYGTDKETREKYNQIITKYQDSLDNPNLTSEEAEFMKTYYDQNGYSDKKDFKDALYEDLQLVDGKKVSASKAYYIAEFYNNSGWDGKPTAEDIQLADSSREETFAQLLSYALGGEDNIKEDFLKMFPKTSKVVQAYLEKHIIK